jgi:hypothetical protein
MISLSMVFISCVLFGFSPVLLAPMVKTAQDRIPSTVDEPRDKVDWNLNNELARPSRFRSELLFSALVDFGHGPEKPLLRIWMSKFEQTGEHCGTDDLLLSNI